MSFGDPNNPYGQPQDNQPGYGYPQNSGQQPGYGYPGQPQQPGPAGYGYPQQPTQPMQPYGVGIPPQAGYGGGMPPLAHWGLRVGAYLIDMLIVTVPYLLLVMIGGSLAASSTSADSAEGGAGIVVVLLGLAWILASSLWLIHKEGSTGQTPGKKAAGIRVLREADGQLLGFGRAFLRKLAHFVDGAACYIGYLWPLWDDKKQTFADKICSTVVIKTGN
jgi:uncharacterized RDD family membrane protein YckC